MNLIFNFIDKYFYQIAFIFATIIYGLHLHLGFKMSISLLLFIVLTFVIVFLFIIEKILKRGL